MSYLWGDLGVVPSESCFSMHGLISLHYTKSGGDYPVGGASEFALCMIPIVETAGGKVGYTVLGQKVVPRLRECCGQSQAGVVS